MDVQLVDTKNLRQEKKDGTISTLDNGHHSQNYSAEQKKPETKYSTLPNSYHEEIQDPGKPS